MTHAETLEVALRLLARSRRVLDYMADEINNGRALNRNDAGIAEELAGQIVALIGHSITDQPEAPEMFALREYLDELAESEIEGESVTDHEHVDGGGEGYCSCGAERCSLPGCDGHCVHPGGWVERAELLEMRRPSAREYMNLISGWWYMRDGETPEQHAARIKSDPRWQESDR